MPVTTIGATQNKMKIIIPAFAIVAFVVNFNVARSDREILERLPLDPSISGLSINFIYFKKSCPSIKS